jgi:hypothetical protein
LTGRNVFVCVAAMYIRRSTRTYKGKTYTNYVLVEAVLTPRGPRQKAVCSLGDLKPRPHKDWLALARKLENALAGQADLLQPGDPVLNRFAEKARRQSGPALSRSVVVPADMPSEPDGTGREPHLPVRARPCESARPPHRRKRLPDSTPYSACPIR